MLENKYIRAAIPALLIHCSIGTVYCWSLFKENIASAIGHSVSSIEWAFSFAIFFLGMSAAFGGTFVEKNVKKSALLSMLCFTAGMIGTGIAIRYQSLIGVYLSYGLIMGIGLGIGYLTPVKTLMLWFSKNKGLATGIAITGFGLAKVIASPLIEYVVPKYGIENMFYLLGAGYSVCMLLGYFLIKKPEMWLEYPSVLNLKNSIKVVTNPTYLAIWFVFFINITCGLALISQEKAIANYIHLGTEIALISGLTALFNSAGRFIYSTLSDSMKDRSKVYEIIFASCFAVVGVSGLLFGFCDNCFTSITPASYFIVLTLVIVNFGYGGGFSTLPSLLSDRFGMNHISTIHGFALSAWAWAGICGNQLSSLILNTTGRYSDLFYLLCILFGLSLAVTIIFIRKVKKVSI